MTLEQGLLWLMGIGAGIVAFWLVERIERSQSPRPLVARLRAWVLGLAPDDKRWLAWAVAGLVAIGAFLASLVMGYRAPPGPWREWVEQIYVVVATAIVAGQVEHTVVTLRRKGPRGTSRASPGGAAGV